MNASLSFALSLFISIALVPVFMRYATTLGLVDTPDGLRKIHTKIIPRSGGIAIAIAFFLTVIYLSPDIKMLSYLVGALVIVFVGVLDDRFELAFYWKFFGQIIATLVFMSGDISFNNIPFIDQLNIPGWLVNTIVFLFIMSVTNAIALSDGLDGLTAGTIVVSLGFIGYLGFCSNEPIILSVAMAIIGALLGFLRYNTHPAIVFMGDTGSQFLGFSAACLAVLVTQLETSTVSPLLPIIIFSLPIIDMMMVMAIRIYYKKSPFSADKNHIHHQLIKIGFHHYEAVALIYLIQFLLIFIGYIFRFESDLFIIILFISIAITSISTVIMAKIYQWKVHDDHNRSTKKERRNLFFRKFNWIYINSATIISISLVSVWFIFSLTSTSFVKDNESLSLLSLTLILISLTLLFFFKRLQTVSTRVISYSVSALVLYPFSFIDHMIVVKILDFSLMIMAVLLLFVVRLTRKNQFRVDNQDILVLFILLSAPLLSSATSFIETGTMLLRLVVMIYAIEYVINRNTENHSLLNFGGLFALAIISLT
ncbi:MAG: glycosyltransferase family 4 protein [Cellvibrionaceae bacterium]